MGRVETEETRVASKRYGMYEAALKRYGMYKVALKRYGMYKAALKRYGTASLCFLDFACFPRSIDQQQVQAEEWATAAAPARQGEGEEAAGFATLSVGTGALLLYMRNGTAASPWSLL